MPVAQGGPTPARQALTVGIAALLGLAAIAFLVTRLDSLTGSGSPSEIAASPLVFPLGPAENMAEAVAESGPILFQDAAGGQRDVYVQHVGSDPTDGWLAFSARAKDATGDCFAEWQPTDTEFVDTCDGTAYPADGTGLTQYAVTLESDGNLILRLEEQP